MSIFRTTFRVHLHFAARGLVSFVLLNHLACVEDPDSPHLRSSPFLSAQWAGDPAQTLVTAGYARLAFDDFLSADSNFSRAVSVRAGSVQLRGTAEWSPVRRQLTFYPSGPPLPQLNYTVSLDTNEVIGVAGQTVLAPPDIEFAIEEPIDESLWQRESAPQLTFDDDILPLLARCSECHGQNELAEITYDTIVLRPSSSVPTRYLVEPFEPARSVLLRRVIPDYAGDGQQMPPWWGQAQLLSLEEQLAVEDWIRGGALRSAR